MTPLEIMDTIVVVGVGIVSVVMLVVMWLVALMLWGMKEFDS